MYFLTLDKIFILDNFSFVQDKKYFVRAEGRGISLLFFICDEGEGGIDRPTNRANQAAFEAVCEIPLQTNIGRLKSLGNIAYSQDLRRSGGNVVARSANEIPSWVEAAAEILTY